MTTREITKDSMPDIAKRAGHKYDHGHALIVTGGPGKTGAARLVARGALRIGAGLVTLACPLRATAEVAVHITSLMLRGLDGPAGLSEMLEDERFTAIGMGPGMGLAQITAELVRTALASKRACVLDADALSRFQRAPDVLFELLHSRCVLTPHEGEFARLFPDLSDLLANDPTVTREQIVRVAAARAGCIVLLKGETTVIADPDGDCAVHHASGARSVPWLATAGAGDVLTGFITGLLARGVAPMQAAEAATWLHVECARLFGPGLIAEDLPDLLPRALRSLYGIDV